MSRHKNKFIILIISSILFTAFYAFLIGGITIKVVERNHARNMIEAIKEDNIEELTRLAKKKINKDAKPNFFVVDRPNSQSLIVACTNHNFEAIKILIENGANPNVVGINGTTPIIAAACGNCEEYYEIIYYLIEHGADISQTDYYGNSALPFIILNDASEKKLELIKYILSLDENLFYFDDEGNVLYTACLRDDINTFEYLFNKYYVDINQKSKNRGNTFLMKTTYYDNIEVFKYLINHGADINIISDEGMTVYDYAVKNKSEKILEYLSKIDN